MPHLHQLPAGSFLPRPPDGFVTRRRTPVAGADLAALNVEVEAAGGQVVRDTVESKSIGRGLGRHIEEVSWYLLPAEAVG